ncbi:Alcohol dehydrogenase [hydrothermal vent metagenome]|uniref:alcohol dehydrogenase (NADP(+)) n=1 Tax=hydrothermal vent metagenome TaxID=652676 RepID=A0A3B0YXI0_9ZZZZ
MIKAYAALRAGAKLEPFEYDPGFLNSDDVEIDIKHCGICHSDLSMINNEWGFSLYPLVPGHEIVGTVSATGENVTSLKVGQLVGLGWHSGYCMTCHSCLAGDHNLCAQAQATIVDHHGGFADKVRARAASVVVLPEGIDLQSAGPLFCGGITVFNPLIQYAVKPTDKVGVIGIGGLGHIAVQFLNAWGCEVTVFTSHESKSEEARKLGAHQVIDSRNPEEIEKAAGKFDMIMSTVNVTLDWNAYIMALKPKGRLHFLGVPLDSLNLGVFPLIMGQRSISGSPVGSPANIAKMLEFAVRHNIKPVVEHYRFDQVNEAMEKLRHGDVRYRIVLSG